MATLDISAPASWGARRSLARSGNPLDLSTRPSGVVDRGTGRGGIEVDGRVLGVKPPLCDAEALVLDLLLQAYRAAKSVYDGVRLRPDVVASVLGVPDHEAAAVIATLRARKLVIEVLDANGIPSGVRPAQTFMN